MSRSWITILSLLLISQLASAKLLLIGKNTFLSFVYVQANFTPIVESAGDSGVLHAAELLDACSDLTNTAEKESIHRSAYVLIIHGGCSFEEKVRHAQKAGYKAAIVYNKGYDELLVPRNSSGVHIHGLLVTRASGEVLKGYVGQTEMEVWFIPGLRTPPWSIMSITFISLLVMSTLLATCFFVCRHQIRSRGVWSLPRDRRRISVSHMPRNLIQRIPTEVFVGVHEVGSTSVTCSICIDDYCIGDKLRILPCQHRFHAACIDSWLGHWRSFCPVCKRDARTGNSDPTASERTPLLSSSLSPSASELSYTVPIYHTQDLTNATSHRFTNRTNSVSASPSWIRSSSMHDLLHQSDPVRSFSLFTSTNYLPVP